jgi:hypothetical protein
MGAFILFSAMTNADEPQQLNTENQEWTILMNDIQSDKALSSLIQTNLQFAWRLIPEGSIHP